MLEEESGISRKQFGAFRKQFPANLGTVFLQLNATNNSTGARSLRTPRNSGGDYPTQASLLEQVPFGQGVGGLACWFQILAGGGFRRGRSGLECARTLYKRIFNKSIRKRSGRGEEKTKRKEKRDY